MPYSYNFFDKNIENYVKTKYLNKPIRILDVGPGSGKYGKMLKKFYKIDALEIYEPYIKQFNLNNIYNKIIINDIVKYTNFEEYDLVIFGDILEHLSIDDAKKCINNVIKTSDILIAVPYEYHNDHHNHTNKHEIHLQPDLTPENMLERYPEVKLLVNNDKYGIYINE